MRCCSAPRGPEGAAAGAGAAAAAGIGSAPHRPSRGAAEEATGPPTAADGASHVWHPASGKQRSAAGSGSAQRHEELVPAAGMGKDTSSSWPSCGDSVPLDGRPHHPPAHENVPSMDPAGHSRHQIPVKSAHGPFCSPAALLAAPLTFRWAAAPLGKEDHPSRTYPLSS